NYFYIRCGKKQIKQFNHADEYFLLIYFSKAKTTYFYFMKFDLTILGSSSATPTNERHPSAQVLNIDDELFLIDCGEGTQMQMRKFKVKFQRINHIFISHLHGDHYLGLAGLLFTYHLLGRTKELHVYANSELQEIIEKQLQVSGTTLIFPLVFHSLPENKPHHLYENKKISISCFPLLHRVPTHGFIFRQKHCERNIIKNKITELNIPVNKIPEIKNGSDFTDAKGKKHSNAELIMEPSPEKVYVYCSDTGYCPKIVPFFKNADILYHEATFMHDMEERANAKQHSTTVHAATIAKKAHVKKLIIGHYSARYDELEPVLKETQNVFSNTEIAEEGKIYSV
ncbi:MAG: ribonuclease Z, partial [Bacteroidales bacterium]|nr:ribonuclease Z [Bacteroidales bacterium]